MRSVLTIFMCVAFVATTSGQSKRALRTFGIGYKKETVIEFNKEGEEKARYLDEEEYYNSDGQWIRKLVYSKSGDLKNEEIRKFHKGEIVDYTEIDYNGSKAKDPYFERFTYEFHKGKLMVETEYDKDGNVVEWDEYTYNKLGDVIKRVRYKADGTIDETTEYTYDRRGLEIEKSTFDDKGRLREKSISVYE